MTEKHVMIDIETFSTRPDAAIAAIGAVAFDIDSGEIDTENAFYTTIDCADSEHPGHIDFQTVYWWLEQPKAAREALLKREDCLEDALKKLTSWFTKTEPIMRSFWSYLPVWSKDPDFDLVILQQAYGRYGLREPWKYRAKRSVRTALADAHRYEINLESIKNIGTAHNALDDAIYQAKQVLRVFQQKDVRMAKPIKALDITEI